MNEELIPKEVDELIARHIRSVGHLEALLFLHANPGRWWSAEEIALELRTNTAYAEQQLKDLQGLVNRKESEALYCYPGEDERTGRILSLVAELYRSHRHMLINAIYSKPIDAIRSFADAFKLKKE